jgi:hypothetical protein
MDTRMPCSKAAPLWEEYRNELSLSQINILATRVTELSSTHRTSEGNDESPLLSHTSRKSYQLKELGTESIIYSPVSPWQPTVVLKNERQKLIFDVLRGNIPSYKEFLKEPALLFSILFKQDPLIFADARQVIQIIFNDMERQLEVLDKGSSFHMEMIIGDLLSLYPFLAPVNGEILIVPIREKNQWSMAPYVVTKLELTGSILGSPVVMYGLEPHSSAPAGMPPLLLFKGTTYPADDGASCSIAADIIPWTSVGEIIFDLGQHVIDSWLQSMSHKGKAVVYGKSLGGSQAWRTALHFPKHVAKVMAYGAPGLFPEDKERLMHLYHNEMLPELNFFCQANDPAPYSDLGAEVGINYYEVLTEGMPDNGVLAHADMYSTHAWSAMLKLNPSAVAADQKRALITAIRKSCSLLLPLMLLGRILKPFVYPEAVIDLMGRCFSLK